MTILKNPTLIMAFALSLAFGMSIPAPAKGQEIKAATTSEQPPAQLADEDLEIIKMLQLLEMMQFLEAFEIAEAMEEAR